MEKPRSTWFVIANGARARILLYRTDSGFEEGRDARAKNRVPLFRAAGRFLRVREMQSPAGHLRTRELGSERPGRAFQNGGASRHAIEPKSDPRLRQKGDFARALAAELVGAARRSEFDRLVLVAPPQVLRTIAGALPPASRMRLGALFPKDLTGLPEAELRQRLSEIARR